MDKISFQARACSVLSQACNTYSKRAQAYVQGVMPTHVSWDASDEVMAGRACECHDYAFYSGGKWYTDYVGGLGSNLVNVQNNYSLPSEAEVILAERVKELFPAIEKLKLLKTGSAACSAAIRFARGHTGKTQVWGTGYHGCDNWAISVEEPGTGTVFEFYRKYKDFESMLLNLRMQDVDDCDLAAVIVEPVQLDINVKPQLLELRKLCTQLGIVLIFDEIITGFRFLDYGVANHFGIQPDIICLGKAMGNGYPISVVGGSAEIMDNPGVFISNTHNGELSAINESLETLNFLSKEKIAELWDRGERFLTGFNGICKVLGLDLKIAGYPTRGELHGDPLVHALFMQEICKRGYFFGKAFFITHAHTDKIINETLQHCMKVLKHIAHGEVKIEGEMPVPLFKRN